MTAAIETAGLGKRYRRHWALRDCDLKIPAILAGVCLWRIRRHAA